MLEESVSVADRSATDCGFCRRSVLVGEPLIPFHDPRTERLVSVCELCRGRASARGWSAAGEPSRRAGSGRLRVEHLPAAPADGPVHDDLAVLDSPSAPPVLATTIDASVPRQAVLERMTGLTPEPAAPALLERMRRQDVELARLRRELDPSQRAEQQRRLERQARELRELRLAVRERDQRIERLQRARHDETSPMRMSGHALDAFNQSRDLERMARIARTLGDPIVNVHDEGAGIPRRVRVTLSWDIAWYEFVVKLDLGAGRASVHQTGSGGDSSVLPLERRRPNAAWRDSGCTLA